MSGNRRLGNAPSNYGQVVAAALSGRETHRPATGPLAVHFCAAFAGVSLRDYSLDAKVLADCVVHYWERFQPDAVWLSADTWVTAEAMGAAVDFPGDNQPLCGVGKPPVRSANDIEQIPPPNPDTQGRWPLMLDALRRIRRNLAGKAFVVACFDQYPFSLACALMGLENVMIQLSDDPTLVHMLMDKCSQYTIAYALALGRTGADMLSGGDSPAGLLGPELYRKIALPYERRVIDALHSHLHLPVSLHICGNAEPILVDMVQSRADVLELDHKVDMAIACRITGPDIAIWGNLDPVGLLVQSTPEQVRKATVSLLKTVDTCRHRRFVLSSGCTLAPDTPVVNLQAMFEAASNPGAEL